MVYPRYSVLFPSLKEVRDSLEKSYFDCQKAVEEKAKALYADNVEKAISYLNEYSNNQAQQMLARWKQLAVYLIVKYNDMTVKPEENGRFLRSKYGLGATPKRPGFPEVYSKKLVGQTGDFYAVPDDKNP